MDKRLAMHQGQGMGKGKSKQLAVHLVESAHPRRSAVMRRRVSEEEIGEARK